MNLLKTMLAFVVLNLIFCLSLQGQQVDILADFCMGDLPTRWEFIEKSGLKPKIYSDFIYRNPPLFKNYLQKQYHEGIKKIIFMNDLVPEDLLAALPKEKSILFLWEPRKVNLDYCSYFYRVYIHDDRIVDGKRFHKFYYPYLMPMLTDMPAFEERKLCVLITRNWTEHRSKIVKFFQKKPFGEFEFYGRDPGLFSDSEMYLGKVPGTHSGDEKLALLKHYRFCFCFENCFNPGYISEKIFSGFAAGCIPVYLGAPNVIDYIPKNCFIDYRDFANNEELYRFLKSMSAATYQRYIECIQAFLQSEQGYLFTPEHFEEIIYEAIAEPS